MSLFQNVYGLLFRPTATLKYLGINYSPSLILQGVLILVLVALANSNEASSLSVVSYIGSWLVVSSLIFLMAFIFKLRISDYPRFLVMLAFANIPFMFLAPIQILAEMNSVISGFLNFLIMIWAFNLNLIAISQCCEISKVRALLIYLLPPLILSLILIKFFFSLFTLI
jgi:hypothetical protein